MRYRDWQEELEAYFAGELAGTMGLRSWLGAWVERESPQGAQSSGSPPEHAIAALDAARQSARVRGALRALTPQHHAILRAHYTPRGPNALKNAVLQEYVAIACVLEGDATIRTLIETKASKGPKARAAGRELRRIHAAAKKAHEGAGDAYQVVREQMRERESDEGRVRRRWSLGL